MARCKAVTASSFVMRSPAAQPTIRRENRSTTMARYSQPSPVQILGDIRSPFLVRLFGGKILLQQIGGDRIVVGTVRGLGEATFLLHFQVILAHQAGDPSTAGGGRLARASPLGYGGCHRSGAMP